MELRAIYRCRICGKRYTDSGTGCRRTAKQAVLEVALNLPPTDPLSPDMYSYHECDDGSIGLADFLGFEAVKREAPLMEDDPGFVPGLTTEVGP